MSSLPSDTIRVLVAGDSGVGKSTLVHLLCHDEVDDSVPWTVGCNIDVSMHKHPKMASPVFVEFFDVGGATAFKGAREVFYKDIDALMLVHDHSNRKSYHNLMKWIREIAGSEAFVAAKKAARRHSVQTSASSSSSSSSSASGTSSSFSVSAYGAKTSVRRQLGGGGTHSGNAHGETGDREDVGTRRSSHDEADDNDDVSSSKTDDGSDADLEFFVEDGMLAVPVMLVGNKEDARHSSVVSEQASSSSSPGAGDAWDKRKNLPRFNMETCALEKDTIGKGTQNAFALEAFLNHVVERKFLTRGRHASYQPMHATYHASSHSSSSSSDGLDGLHHAGGTSGDLVGSTSAGASSSGASSSSTPSGSGLSPSLDTSTSFSSPFLTVEGDGPNGARMSPRISRSFSRDNHKH